MGLDNGIYARNMNEESVPNFIGCEVMTNSIGEKEIEFAYWRKCWGFRDEVIKMLHVPDEGGVYKLDAEDINGIIRILKKYLHADYWDENEQHSVWTYDEYIECNIHNLMSLMWLHDYCQNNSEIEIFFYDSY